MTAPTHFGRQVPHHHTTQGRIPVAPESAKEKERQARRRAAEKEARADEALDRKTR